MSPGTMDGFGWANNTGDFRVTINAVPDYTPFCSLTLVGLLLASVVHRRLTV
jgi:hypothetical protein